MVPACTRMHSTAEIFERLLERSTCFVGLVLLKSFSELSQSLSSQRLFAELLAFLGLVEVSSLLF